MKKRNLFITTSLTLCLIMLGLSAPVTAGETEDSPMRVILYDLNLLFDLGIVNDDGQLLVWTGKIKGHVDGYMAWWFDLPFKEPLIHDDFVIDFYSSRWEIFDSDPYPPDGSGGVVFNPDAKLLLAGLSAGETLYATDPADSDGNWDGDGIVTETCREYRKWRGCIMHESGPVLISSLTGAPGKVRIYPKSFRPRDLLNKPVKDNPKEKKSSEALELVNNYPNPFNPTTTIAFNLAEATHVKIDIYNSTGQIVNTLLEKNLSAGNHSIEWNASDMASGIYFYKIQVEGMEAVKRVILLK